MAAPIRRKIPTEVETEILSRAAKGESSDSIATWLEETHGIEVTSRTIRRIVAAKAAMRGEVTKGAVRDLLGPQVVSDVDELRSAAERVKGYEAALVDKGDLRGATLAAKAVADILDKRLHYAGADAEGEELVPAALADLLEAAATPEGAS